MGILNYFIWNASPEIFSFTWFSLRWYGLLFALGFLITQQILYYMYRKEGKPESDVDTLTIYMVIATILGARLGHVIFYEPHIIWEKPLSIFLPFEFSPNFQFTGLQGLASHGAAIGILLALYIYSRKRKPGQTYLYVLDRIVILIALTGAMIRLGNYFNSEIIGKPSDAPWAVVMVNPLTKDIERNDINKDIESISYVQNDSSDASTSSREPGQRPMYAYITYKTGTSLAKATSIAYNAVNSVSDNRDHFEPIAQQRTVETAEGVVSKISLVGIARHPAQLYEAISCVALFLLLMGMWFKHKEKLVPGRIFGIFLLWLWPMRYLIEFFKEPQVTFEEDMTSFFGLNMGQALSIPLIIAGIIILVRSYRKKEA
ncbi:prolipoprotein diacylglyceryl transferase [Pseudochryseolinea flava]|uniref:Phosphatidylglycerol--prolipoprotein diacylglyceryl transferase n=1 Tax=Pseudochryseolinea flava TaxID=2059302 RepID=A0A364XZF3_9BACT|nr:prolipoprotein diacylglyceryl transferase [Pseudochryseolinea flava]RAV98821.1 prolipoprotein diacylglyceryl transferase [Pseudochryseolinea flava]